MKTVKQRYKDGEEVIEESAMEVLSGISPMYFPLGKRKVHICKKCGNEFYAKRAKHDICYDCFSSKNTKK